MNLKKWMCLLLSITLPAISMSACAAPKEKVTPMEKYGAIRVADVEVNGRTQRQLCDEAGNPIQLRGMSSFGVQWDDGHWIFTEEVFDVLAYDWKCDIIRLAMYVTEGGYKDQPGECLARIEQGIEMATRRGMYVIVDWHILSPGDPMDEQYLTAGMDLPEYAAIRRAHPEYNGPQLFFAYLAEKYGQQSNVLFEPANEPNGNGVQASSGKTWSEKLKPYYEDIIAAIEEYDADDVPNIVICGTDNWSQFVDAPLSDPIDYDQVMYTMHFYSGTHDTGSDYWLKEMVDKALEGGLAVFCTEWGTSEATGDGGPYIHYAQAWVEYMEKNMISWCNWSLAKKNEISAANTSRASSQPVDNDGDGIPDWTEEETSVSGRFVRAMIRGEAAPIIVSRNTPLDFEDGSTAGVVPVDSPNTDLSFENVQLADGNSVLKIGNVLCKNSQYDNRAVFQKVDIPFGLYKDFTCDVYVEASVIDSGARVPVSIQPVLQYEDCSWWGELYLCEISVDDFVLDEGSGLYKASISAPVSKLEPAPEQVATHVVLMMNVAKEVSPASIYVDNVGFETISNGDVADQPKMPDQPGEFAGLPVSFETGTREGWRKEGDSLIENEMLSIGMAESQALSFLVALNPSANEWEDGARISSPFLSEAQLSLADCKKISAITLDVYLEKDKASCGNIEIGICPVPNGAGYWHQAGIQVINPMEGEVITNADGVELYKYTLVQPFTIEQYAQADIPMRNLVLALYNSGSDYQGQVYYDNIALVLGE